MKALISFIIVISSYLFFFFFVAAVVFHRCKVVNTLVSLDRVFLSIYFCKDLICCDLIGELLLSLVFRVRLFCEFGSFCFINTRQILPIHFLGFN